MTNDRENGSGSGLRYCAAPPRTMPTFTGSMPLNRMRAIIVTRTKWVNGTTLRYHFLAGPEHQQAAVRSAFEQWKKLGIGLSFLEVDSPAEAEVRIGFDQDDGSWSYLGRDILEISSPQQATMNFGWDLRDAYGMTTALHEIGHTLGKPHEHQNPLAGILWDEDAVYKYFGGPPNNWDRDTTYYNVVRKLDPGEVEGSSWDPDSIMQYSFPAGVIKEPQEYADHGIAPSGVISQVDKEYVLKWYPPLDSDLPRLTAFSSVPLHLKPTQQADYRIEPTESRTYSVGTFGDSDAVLVLFEEVEGELRYRSGDDASGQDRNTLVRAKLFRGRKYVVRVRLNYSEGPGDIALMLW